MSLKIADTQEDLVSYLKFQIEGRNEISVILFSDTLSEILDDLKSYGRKLTSFSCEIDSDSESYVVTKYLNEINKECLMIEPLYQFDKETEEFEPIYIKDEYILIEEFVLDEDEIEGVVKSDCYETIGLIEHHPELEEKQCKCYHCEGCASACHNGEFIKDNTHEDEDFEEECIECETLEEVIDVFTDIILQTGGCRECIHDILEDLCNDMIEEGIRQEALRRYNEDNERLFGDEGLMN